MSATFLGLGSKCDGEMYRHESIFHGHGGPERGDKCLSIGVGDLEFKRIKDI